MRTTLKRIAAPKTWKLFRKSSTFITKPNPGGHPMDKGMALGVLLRDNFKIVKAMREARRVLHQGKVLVDGVVRKDPRFIVGLFDVISLPSNNEFYRLTIDNKNKLAAIKIDEGEANKKPVQVLGKKIIRGGKTQLFLHDGRTMLFEGKVKVGDSLLLYFSDKKIDVLPLEKGRFVFIKGGSYSGSAGIVQDLADGKALVKLGEVDVLTSSRFVVPVGKSVPDVRVVI